MSELSFDVVRLSFDELNRFASFEAFTRLRENGSMFAGAVPAAVGQGQVSTSPFMDRGAVAQLLDAINPGLPTPPQDAAYVIGGQQAGLLTGPLYAFLKAVTCIRIAQALRESTGGAVFPLFWVASEDHDVLEVNRVTVSGERFVHSFNGDIRRGHVPQVAEISLQEAREPLLRFLRNVLPRTEFTQWVLGIVSELDYSSYASAFCDMLSAVMAGHGLRIVDPISVRKLTGPVLASLVERWPDLEEALIRGSEAVAAQGVQPPLPGLRLFEIVDGRRVPVERISQGLRLSMGRCSFREAADRVRGAPQNFSPGAALRPLLQDAVLPTAVTVAGPTELAYLVQIAPLYGLTAIRASARAPRISATFVEPAIRRAADRVGLRLSRLFDVVSMMEEDGATTGVPWATAIARKGDELLKLVDGLPHSPKPRWLRSSRAGIEAAVSRITRRLEEEKLEASGITRERLRRVADAILPGGTLQERIVNVTQFLNLHGPEFVACAVGSLDPTAHWHQIVSIVGGHDRPKPGSQVPDAQRVDKGNGGAHGS
jgi:bacillithiol biosynthesis cysteine-adding enzyme BshC